MVDEHILPDDMVIVEETKTAENGETVVALLDGENARTRTRPTVEKENRMRFGRSNVDHPDDSTVSQIKRPGCGGQSFEVRQMQLLPWTAPQNSSSDPAPPLARPSNDGDSQSNLNRV